MAGRNSQPERSLGLIEKLVDSLTVPEAEQLRSFVSESFVQNFWHFSHVLGSHTNSGCLSETGVLHVGKPLLNPAPSLAARLPLVPAPLGSAPPLVPETVADPQGPFEARVFR